MRNVARLMVCITGLLPATGLWAGDAAGVAGATGTGSTWWPQFRGPNAGGTSANAKPPTRFGPGQNELWNIEVPWSPSSPAIWADRIYVSTFHDGQLETRAYDRESGRLLWARGVKPEQLETFHRTDGSPAASTPATDGRRVVSYFGSFGLICHDPDGKELWRLPLPLALSGGNYGSGTSPVMIGERVFLNRDQDVHSSLLAVDLATGKKAWEANRAEIPGGFGTPVHWRNGDVDEVVVAGSLQLKGYDAATGAERWVVNGTAGLVCTTPSVFDGWLYFGAWAQGKADTTFPLDWPTFAQRFDANHDGQVDAADSNPVTWDFLRGIDRNRDGRITAEDLEVIKARAAKGDNVLLAVRPGGKGDITGTHVAWKATRGLPYVASPLCYDGRVYLVKDGGLMSSYDARTGQGFYVQERLGAAGNYYASPVAADGRIYLASLSGKVTVVKAGGAAPEVLHQAEFGERIFATPALVGDRLYLRTEKHLRAFAGESLRADVQRPAAAE